MTHINSSKQKTQFEQHLNYERSRVVFSGIFGIGKTTFLKNFFSENSKFNSLHLFPVNYSTASNTDIFELIKYDILYELLTAELDYEKIEFSNDLQTAIFVQNNTIDLLCAFIQVIPKVGKTASKVLKSLADLYQKFEEQKEETNINQFEHVRKFLEEVRSSSGSIYEHDFHTELIEELLKQLSFKSGKENVLIIDDLERVDPDHIFRLLNIFAAHVDQDGENKFGFSKIILVLDVQNLKSIFHHKYGKETNFEGFIDKFYSRDIFFFDNRDEIKNEVQNIIRNSQTEEGIDSEIFKSLVHAGDYANKILVGLIHSMILSSTLNLRTLTKHFDKIYSPKIYIIHFPNLKIWNEQILVVRVLDFLLSLFNTYEGLLDVVKKTSFKGISLKDKESKKMAEMLIPQLIFIIDHEQHQFRKMKHEFVYGDLKLEYSTLQIEQGYNNKFFPELTGSEQNINIGDLLTQAILTLHQLPKSDSP